VVAVVDMMAPVVAVAVVSCIQIASLLPTALFITPLLVQEVLAQRVTPITVVMVQMEAILVLVPTVQAVHPVPL
jgi:hypothetical protein